MEAVWSHAGSLLALAWEWSSVKQWLAVAFRCADSSILLMSLLGSKTTLSLTKNSMWGTTQGPTDQTQSFNWATSPFLPACPSGAWSSWPANSSSDYCGTATSMSWRQTCRTCTSPFWGSSHYTSKCHSPSILALSFGSAQDTQWVRLALAQFRLSNKEALCTLHSCPGTLSGGA